MSDNVFRILISALLAGVLASLIALYLQNRNSIESMDKQRTAINRVLTDLASLREQTDTQVRAMADLDQNIASLKEDIESVKIAVERIKTSTNYRDDLVEAPLSKNPKLLAPGIYMLAAKIEENATEVDTYTIYHVTATVGSGELNQNLQFGAANSGIFSWRFYFDYDNDGNVDTDMLRDFIDSIPFGKFMSGSLDKTRTQGIYDRFLRSADGAAYTPPDKIEEQSSELSQQFWKYVTSTSEKFASWMMGRLESETPQTAPQTTL